MKLDDALQIMDKCDGDCLNCILYRHTYRGTDSLCSALGTIQNILYTIGNGQKLEKATGHICADTVQLH
jgi:hypothetical protein